MVGVGLGYHVMYQKCLVAGLPWTVWENLQGMFRERYFGLATPSATRES